MRGISGVPRRVSILEKKASPRGTGSVGVSMTAAFSFRVFLGLSCFSTTVFSGVDFSTDWMISFPSFFERFLAGFSATGADSAALSPTIRMESVTPRAEPILFIRASSRNCFSSETENPACCRTSCVISNGNVSKANSCDIVLKERARAIFSALTYSKAFRLDTKAVQTSFCVFLMVQRAFRTGSQNFASKSGPKRDVSLDSLSMEGMRALAISMSWSGVRFRVSSDPSKVNPARTSVSWPTPEDANISWRRSRVLAARSVPSATSRWINTVTWFPLLL